MLKMRIGSVFMEGIAVGYLSICAIFDIRKKEIPLILVIAGLITTFGINLWQIWGGLITAAEAGYSVLPGVFFLLISFGTREKIGYGDGLLLITAGLLLGFYQCFMGLCIGLACSCVFALYLLVSRKAGRSSTIPFVPFLAVGMGVEFFVSVFFT